MAGENRNMDRKAVFQPYDMDTAIGTNNSGILMFSPYLEDTDTVDSVIAGGDDSGSNAPVYNAQDSVLWNNMRDAFRDEMRTMYRSLRTATEGSWNYAAIEKRFEDHQAIWPEAIFNEDSWVKYITPLVEPVTVDEETGRLIRTTRYLTMLQGSKEEQRKWWLYNRFRYLDSKYHTGNAVANSIDIRLFNNGTLRIKAAIPLYLGVSFGLGSTPELKRRNAGEVAEFIYDSSQHLDDQGSIVTEMETSIWSGNLITDVGDLSGFYPNECNFAKAVLLKRLKIGDQDSNYSNGNLRVLDVQNCPLLEYINCANSPNLASTINLENSSRLVEAYFEGTAITGIDLADGCVIEKLHLPSTIVALTLLNLNKLSEFQIPNYSNVSRVMLSNIDSTVVDPVEILDQIPDNSQVNIQGLYLELDDYSDISDFYDQMDKMTGVTRERIIQDGEYNWIYHPEGKAILIGEIHANTLSGEEIDELTERYPYVDLTAEHTSAWIKYYSYDGSTLLRDPEVVVDGANATWNGSPSRTADAQYTYTFAGWSTTPNGDAEVNATKNVSKNRCVYAAYSKTVNTYTVTWKNANGTVLETDSNVPYGTVPTYNGATPTQDGEESTGWEPDVGPITGNTVYTAIYIPVYTVTFVRSENDGAGTLYTARVKEGSVPVYGGETPTTSQGTTEEFTFIGWVPTLSAAYNDATYTAKFMDNRSLTVQYISCTMTEYTAQPEEVAIEEFSGSWSDLIDSIDDGSYLTTYKLGQYKTVDFGSEGNIQMQIIAFNKDVDEDGNCIPITLLSRKQLSGGGVAFGSNSNTFISWKDSNVRTQLYSRILNNIPEPLKSRLIPCVKYTCDTEANAMSIEELFIPSRGELFDTLPSNGSYTSETMGPVYSGLFIPKSGWYWTRSKVAVNDRRLQYCQGGNLIAEGQNTYQYDIYFGFCIGRVN